MRTPLMLAVAGLAAVMIAGASLAQPAARLEGAWTAVAAERDGRPAPDVVGHRLTLAGGAFAIQRDGKTLYAGTYRTNSSATPMQIDFLQSQGELKGRTWKGIYRLEGDTLNTCDNAPAMDKPRPASFAAQPGSGYISIVFKRDAR